MSAESHYPTNVSNEQWDIFHLLLPTPTWRPSGHGQKPMDLRLVKRIYTSYKYDLTLTETASVNFKTVS
jgi:hypothetical protein